MPLLLHELQWADEPLVPKVSDPVWEAELKALMGGMVPDCLQRLSPSPWVRRAYLDATRTPVDSLTDPETELAVLVTSQENACRYCYGVARTRLRMLGFTEAMVDQVERRAQLAEGDDRERELVRFCRDLARSKPRPAKKAREAMASVGFTARQTAELAYTVASAGFCNRVSTLIAADPEYDFEQMAPKPSLWAKLASWRPGKSALQRLPPPDYPPPTFQGPFGSLVRLLEGTRAAATLETTLNNAFSSDVLPPRTLALMFAVVARTLDCTLCETNAADLLQAHGVSPTVRKEVLDTLGSPALTEVEAVVIPWARETVWMPEQPARIQERSRPVLEVIGPRMFIEVVGGAALANACVRIAMLVT
jgi:uncharacterized peroxidase-related enzyme